MNKCAFWRQEVPWLRLIGLALLGVLLSQLDVAAIARVLQTADWVLLMMAIVLNLPMVLLKSLRWQALMHSQDIRYSISKAYLAYFGSIFVGFLTPGRLGEFVKAIHVNHDCEVSIVRAFSSVLADRLFDLYALLLVGVVAVLTLTVGNTQVIALIGSAVLLTVPLGLLLSSTTFGWLQQVSLRLGLWNRKLVSPGNWLLEIRAGLCQLTWLAMLSAIALTALAYGIFFGQCYLLALALGLPATFASVSYAVALGNLVTLLPISISGIGTRDAAIVAYLGMVGVPSETALAFSVLVFLTFYIGGGLIGAAAWWIKPAPLGDLKLFGSSAKHPK
jgi:uncharacterized membrane protein YbhN (UPF0104 family)